MKKGQSIGTAEYELMQFLAEHGPATVRQVAETYGAPRGLVRTTVLQMMERLRKKGFLQREAAEGGFSYRSTMEATELRSYVVERFVDSNLGGSVSPLVAFLAGHKGISAEDAKQLRELLDKLEREKGK